MKNKQLRSILAAGITTLPLLFMNSAMAHEGGAATNGYVGDGAKHIVTSGFGDCVRTGYWSKDDATTECDADLLPPPAPVAVAPPPPPPAPMPKMEPVYETTMIKAGALFDHDKAIIKADGAAQLDRFAAGVKGLARVDNIKIVGHTDSSGSNAYNDALSMRRATSVKNYLLNKGLDPKTMSTVGMGESSPVASNATKEGRAQNRRVEITLEGARRVK